ncbi:uncharacterized protein LOC121595652 isoform X1 [Anopheles merus]|uniref:uncharacterized protein LOC121595652 isoform X1 n=1 Tax=Anopheles merus TaxID=30066 RepID=UPI001BE40C93|nr:uncharacterized protein LOC121595652 isoform X1 [Anopheles merus]XP_041775713.1 uncharacterized protein LOC121595652 isoform X1 [Anopheles merus]XP_041775714.1 uncharacterized protein LOC121595652 isoform X1 [Anopheles merus]XP_041775715.1 uncharacterized protein LOC121595652 isoform X1 [Anopheles merus]XP_041775716.1 uncharacterized protein LOC121595652 isoform X1 [Anopheles merus]XP_041775718.1 uncharacterized protein LOC121595652 isoform X1 [Anopheles merus]
MKSSMAITKSAAFRFLLLLHLFLKVKMCVGFVDAASAVGAAGDSDINYDDDSDEWLGVAGGGEGTANRVAWSVPSSSSSASNIPPAPANLMRWEPARDTPAAGRYRMHHVRHEQHYLKQRPAKVPNPSTESTLVAAAERDPYRAHTVTGADQQQQQKAHHHSHHHHHHHQQQQHPRSHHAHHYKHHRKTGVDGSEEEVGPIISSSRTFSNERRHWFEQGSFKDAWNSMSGTGRDDRQVAAINRKRSASSFHSVSSNALPDASGSRSTHAVSSRDRTSKQSSQKSSSSSSSISPGSKNYFEQLLNNYKNSSPYYKELHQASKTPQTKALPSSSRRNQRSSAEVTKSKASQQHQQQQQQGIDGDLDYLYDDETEESVQNDAPVFGGTMSTSTRAPASTTTTSTTTTTTTTPRAILSASSDSDEASGGGSNDGSAADPSYSSYYQKAYAIHSNPRRNGNNRYNSLTRTAAASPTAVNHHSKRPHFDRIDPAKQVAYPGRYQSFTDYKQANFGTKDAVERSYSAYSNSQHERHQAKQHMERMIREGMCKVPKPRIVPASNDRTKLFTPQCTILHRCEDDTGCCGPTQTCAPKTTSEVQLYFYVSSDSYVQNVGQRQQNTIALTFSNHTECHCVQRSSSSVRMQSHNLLEHSAEGSEGTGGSSSSSSSCTCPGPFKSVNDGTLPCYCDCLSSDQVCVRFKEGFESFSMETRKCIRSKRCTVPQCEYGIYNSHEGRCPKKSDRINEQFSLYR